MNRRITTYCDRQIVSYKTYIVKKHTFPNSILDQVILNYFLCVGISKHPPLRTTWDRIEGFTNMTQ